MSEAKQLSGLQKVCKIYGRMKCGDTMMVWDYANDVAIPESEMKKDRERWKASERVKHEWLKSLQPHEERY